MPALRLAPPCRRQAGRPKPRLNIAPSFEAIAAMSDNLIMDVIDYAHEKGFCLKDDKFNDFKVRKPYLFDRLAKVKYGTFRKLYDYLEGRTTFSTQHKIKGREFERVLVVLDAGGWNNYNFKYLFEGGGTETVRERTSKLFYVCCTRAKQELAVYYRNPTPGVLIKAEIWFGKENVVAV
jgi:DNA helicase-2/ATP-dependent DNA helicase PcrA